MQPGHRGLDSCKGVLEISTKDRIANVDARKPVGINATRPQHPNMFATQRNHQISSKVIITDQRSPMIRRHRITTLTQHRARVLIGAITHTSGGARTGHPHHITQTTLPQLLSEQRRCHHRSRAIETADKRNLQPRATHNPYRFPSSAARSSESSKSKFENVHNSVRKIRVTYKVQAHDIAEFLREPRMVAVERLDPPRLKAMVGPHPPADAILPQMRWPRRAASQVPDITEVGPCRTAEARSRVGCC